MKIKSLKTHHYEKKSENKGGLKYVGSITHKELFEALKGHLESLGMLPDDYFLGNRIPELMSEGDEYPEKALESIPEDCYFTARSDFGGSEGIYLDIEMHSVDGKGRKHHEHLVTGKTLKEDPAALIWMQRAATECELFLNGNGKEYEVNDIPKAYALTLHIEDKTSALVFDTFEEAAEKAREIIKTLPGIEIYEKKEDCSYIEGFYNGWPMHIVIGKIE